VSRTKKCFGTLTVVRADCRGLGSGGQGGHHARIDRTDNPPVDLSVLSIPSQPR